MNVSAILAHRSDPAVEVRTPPTPADAARARHFENVLADVVGTSPGTVGPHAPSSPRADVAERLGRRSTPSDLLAVADVIGSGRVGAAPASNATAIASAHALPSPAADLGEQLAGVAREYVGLLATPTGTDPNTGLGPTGFVQHATSRLGMTIPATAALSGIGQPVASLEAARPGDLVVLRSGTPGVYLGDGKAVFSDPAAGSIRVASIDGEPAAIRRIVAEGAPLLEQGAQLRSTQVTDSSLVEAPSGFDGLAGVPFADLFVKEGTEHGVDPRLLAAVAWQESRFKPTAVSHAGAQGLMQIMPATARGLGVADSFDPAQAVDGAARLLASHLDKYDGSIRLALAAYNAGGGNVDRYGGVPPFKETQHYVVAVQEKYEEFRR